MTTTENVTQLLQQAKQGDAVVQNNLGLLYLNENDTPAQDVDQAWYWFNEAAKQEFEVVARLNLGKMYREGLIQDYTDDMSKAKTGIAKTLFQLRRQALAKGMPLLTVDEINDRVRQIRGGSRDRYPRTTTLPF
jgi:TPR repeat protein